MKYKNLQLFDLIFFVIIVVVVLLFALSTRAQTIKNPAPEITASGAFTLEKAVVAGGGSEMTSQPVNQTGTSGQTVAGIRSNGGQFSLYSGFWTPDDFAPTAANAVVGGRIKTSDGRGIRNVLVTITFPSGETRTTLSSTFGYYRFAEIPSGDTYIISVSAKKYKFAEPARVLRLLEDAQDIDFIADAINPIKF